MAVLPSCISLFMLALMVQFPDVVRSVWLWYKGLMTFYISTNQLYFTEYRDNKAVTQIRREARTWRFRLNYIEIVKKSKSLLYFQIVVQIQNQYSASYH